MLAGSYNFTAETDSDRIRGTALNLPNLLTISRIVMIPLMAGLLLYDNLTSALIAGVIFIIATITDWLDGHLARKYEQVSDLGALLDPLADKLLITTALVMLIPLNRVPAWVVAVIIGREMAITGLRAIAAEKGVVIPAGWLGKYKTSFQCAALIPLILHFEIMGVNFQLAGEFFLWIALFFTVWSGWDYIYDYAKQTRLA